MHRPPANPYSAPREVVTLEIKVSPAKVPSLTALPKAAPGPVRKVLLLDDRDDFRDVLRDHLIFRGFQVTSVPSGVEGLVEITKGVFDLILCDMMMPRSGGEMFYWAVTRLRPGAADRFIFFTGHRNQPAIEFFFERVKATVLLKPFPLSALDSEISNILRKVS